MAYQIDDITAVQTPDPLPTDAISQPGYFTNGDPSDKGLGATFVPAWWLNMVQGELLSICEKAGITPDKTNNAQVVAAIVSLIDQKRSELTNELNNLISTKLNRTGDTTSGNLVYQSNTQVAPWASTPQAIFQFGGSKALGALFGQIRDDGSFQTLLYAQNVDGVNKAWGFRSNDGHVSTPNGHVLLEVDDVGNGHLVAQNIGSASGQTLANMDDVTTETQRAQAAESQLVSGVFGKSASDIQINGLYWTEALNAPSVVYKDSGGKNVYSLLVTKSGLNSVLAGYQPAGDYQTAGDYATHSDVNNALGSYYRTSGGVLNGNAIVSDQSGAESQFQINLENTPVKTGYYSIFDGSGWQRAGKLSQDIGKYSIALFDSNFGNFAQWTFDRTKKTIITPQGHSLLETSNSPYPRLEQSFIAQAMNGDWIAWPLAFARDDNVVVQITATDGGNGNLRAANVLVGNVPNRFGVHVAVGDPTGPAMTPVTLYVTVKGYSR